ncbi:MAG: S1/P1 nuclease [Pyrinomonadaceae bacterium]
MIIDNDRKRLHSYWDFDLVTSLMLTTGQPSSDRLGLFLRQTVKPRSHWASHGSIGTWAAQWATDSLHLSRNRTYKSVKIVRQRTLTVMTREGQPVIRDGQPVTEIVYDVTLASNYQTANRQMVRRQLAKAGFRLARLLDAIYSSN